MTGGKCPLKPVSQPENPERRSWVLLECCRLGSELFTILYPAVGSLRLQQSGTFDERDVQLAYKQWVAKKRAQTQWCAWVHTSKADTGAELCHCLAALNKGADGPWVGSGDSPTFVLLQHCPHLPLHKQMRTKKSY